VDLGKPHRGSRQTSRLIRQRPSPDGGFTLIELMVAISLMGIVMVSLAAYFASAVAGTNHMRLGQVASMLGDQAMEQVRALSPPSLVKGRDQSSVTAQWSHPAPGVVLSDMAQTWDPAAASGSGASAALPTSPTSQTADGVRFQLNWYVGLCWQALGGGSCTQTSSSVQFYRVVVAVNWPARGCPASGCSYVTASLINAGKDPVFNNSPTTTTTTTTYGRGH